MPSACRRRPALSIALLVVLALPVLMLVVGGARIFIYGSGGLDRVSDPVSRIAQAQQVDDRADRQAAAMGLRAELRQPPGPEASLRLSAAPEHPLPERLTLKLEHPIEAKHDLSLNLQREGDTWRGPRFNTALGWRVSLMPTDGHWRLVGLWPRGGDSLDLLPALATGPEAADGTR